MKEEATQRFAGTMLAITPHDACVQHQASEALSTGELGPTAPGIRPR